MTAPVQGAAQGRGEATMATDSLTRRDFGLTLGAAAGGLALAGPAHAQQRAPDTVTVTAEQPVVSLQTWLDTYGRPAARVMLNGRGPYRFLVDTGSNTTVLADRVAAELGLPLEAQELVLGVTGSRMAARARLQRVAIGQTETLNVRAVVFDGPAFARLDGILGMDVFANRRVRFNFQRQEVEFADADTPTNSRLPIRSSFRLRQGLLIEAEGRIATTNLRCVLDTGAETSLINLAALRALTRPTRRRSDESTLILGATDHTLRGQLVAVPPLTVIGMTVSSLTVVAADAPIFGHWGMQRNPVMLVGMDVMSRLETLQIDYRRRTVQLRTLSSNLMSGTPALNG